MNNRTRLFNLRKNYTQAGLSEADALSEPIEQFRLWFQEALQAEITEPNAMTLSTSDKEGDISSRTVLLKEFDERGFVFYTNYNSRKSMQIETNPKAALLFLWIELERQIRIEGMAERISSEESNEYFKNRPRESQLGAWASEQSATVASREELDVLYKKFSEKFEGSTVPRPSYWGGYRIIPNRMEFWQGRTSRMHDRILYTLENETNQWKMSRLAP